MSSSLGTGALASSGNYQSGANEGFPDPWLDYSSTVMPEMIQYVLRWCEYIVMANGTYRQALDRILSYFITEIKISNVVEDDKEKWEKFINETLDIKNQIHTIGMDAMVYGNSFTSVLPTFKRYLACKGKGCGNEAPLDKIFNEPVFRFKWSNYEFHASCPKCGYSGEWRHIDRRNPQDSGFKIKRWNVHEMELLWDPLTESCDYIWKIPEDYRKMIREGHLYHLERANWDIIQAIKHNNYFKFAKDFVYHWREDALAGIRARGWGISRVMANFRQAWYVQVLHRFNEAIALDYVQPFRVITPVKGDKNNGTDVLLNMYAGDFMSTVMGMVKRRRQDPAAWFSLPFPVEYNALGGDAEKMCPKDLMENAVSTLLSSIGCPAEIYNATLTLQTAPAALRLFESSFCTLPHNMNAWLRFILKNTARILNWNEAKATMTKVTHADDVQRQMSKLQLGIGGQVSPTTMLETVGLKYKEEVEQTLDDQKFQAEQQAKLQEEMDHAANQANMAQPPQPQQPGQPGQAGGMAGVAQAQSPGGQQAGGQQAQPGQQGGQNAQGMAQQDITANMDLDKNTPITPEELDQKASTIASQLMGLSEAEKDSALHKIKSKSETLHSTVKAKMDDMRRDAKNKGGAQVLQQQFGKQGAANIQNMSILKNRRNIKL